MAQRFLVPLFTIIALTISACKEDTADALARVDQEWSGRDAKIEQIKDADTRENFAQMAQFLGFMERSRIEAQIPPKETRYTVPALERLDDYANPSEMTKVFLGASFIEALGTTFRRQYPFDYPLPYEIGLTSVQLDNGQTVAISDDYLPENPEIQAARNGSMIHMVYDPSGRVPEGQALPTSVSGTFTAELPGKVLQVGFDKGEVGDSRQTGDYSVTLLQVDGHQVAVGIERTDGAMPAIDTDAIYIEAQDQTGRYLDDRSSGWGNPEDFAKLVKALDIALDMAVNGGLTQADSDKLFQKISDIGGLEESPRIYGEVDFRGTPDRIKVTILAPDGGQTFTKEITLPVRALENYSKADAPEPIPVTGPVFNHSIEAAIKYQPIDLTREEIATKVTITQPDYGHSVHFNYPDVLSDIFIDGFSRFEGEENQPVPVTFLDAKGNPIEGLSEEAFKFTIDRIEYDPALFPRTPVRVVGQVPVRRLTDMPRVTYEADALPEGLQIKGNMLLVDPARFPDWGEDILAFATTDDGRFLTRFHEQRLSGQRQVVDYFYGDIGGVVLFERGADEVVPFSFDVKLEPLDSDME